MADPVVSDVTDSDAPASGILVGLTAKIVFVSFCMLALLMGAWVAGAGFHDPDTCWIVALGRWIFDHGGLPSTDPFSYTFIGAAPGTPHQFVLYQWLTELTLFVFYKAGGLLGILLAVGCVVNLALLAIPLATFEGIGVSRLRAFGLIALGFGAAAFHLLIRPEIFSYLFLSLWLSLLTLLRAGAGAATVHESQSAQPLVDWKYVAAFALIMTLWCNYHTGFTSGLIVMFVVVLCGMSAKVCGKAVNKRVLYTAATALVISFLCTLINPYGIGLLQYIPHLYFGGFNKNIVEVQPLRLADLKDPAWYPFIILTAITIKSFLRNVKSSGLFTGDRLASGLIIIVLVIVAVCVRRLVSFNAVIMMYECAWLRSQLPARSTGFIADSNARLAMLFRTTPISLGVMLVLSLAGVVMIASGPVKPRLPQPSKAFTYPDKAITYLAANPPRGPGFNSPQLGDVMIWNLNPCPKLFIDTRFDMYGAELVDAYRTIVACKPGWEDLVAKYQFHWVLIHDEGPFATFIRSSPDWNVRVTSDQSIYAERK